MALGNLPGLPQKYNSRFRELIQKLKNEEMTLAEVGENILKASGRIRIDSEGINISGDFGNIQLGPPELRAIFDTALNIIEYLPILKDKQLLVKKGLWMRDMDYKENELLVCLNCRAFFEMAPISYFDLDLPINKEIYDKLIAAEKKDAANRQHIMKLKTEKTFPDALESVEIE